MGEADSLAVWDGKIGLGTGGQEPVWGLLWKSGRKSAVDLQD